MSMRVLLALSICFLSLVTSALAQSEPLQPGDNLQISVWQDPKLDRKVVVGPDGMISFPLAGHIKTTGMTPQASRKGSESSGCRRTIPGALDITVSLADVNKEAEALTTPRFFVTGEVQKPGPYVLRPGTSVVQAFALAGGLGIYAAPPADSSSPASSWRRFNFHL